MPKFKKNPNPIMKKQAYGIAKTPFTMKYKNSAFPFKGGPEVEEFDIDKYLDEKYPDPQEKIKMRKWYKEQEEETKKINR